jgi:polyphosphate kinase
MTRNLDSRVEAVTPVEDPAIRDQLRFIIDLMLADNRRVWEMESDGSYSQRRPAEGERTIDTQAVLMREARVASEREDVSRGTPRVTDVPDSGLRIESTTDGGDEGTTTDRESDTEPRTNELAEDGEPTFEAGDLPELLRAHRSKWYEPDSATYSYAVRTPDGDRVYRKTARGAAKVIGRHYADSAELTDGETDG